MGGGMVTPAEIQSLAQGTHGNPFSLLGLRPVREGLEFRAWRMFARAVRLIRPADGAVWEVPAEGPPGLFRLLLPGESPFAYEVETEDEAGGVRRAADPYAFPPRISEFDLHLFGEGSHVHAQGFLGARPDHRDGVAGVQFAVWAPNAERVGLVGDFTRWDGRALPMQQRGHSGIWELFVPGLGPGEKYKFEVRARDGSIQQKQDPFARFSELRPGTASIVWAEGGHAWQDQGWMEARARTPWHDRPISVYEVHAGSWRKGGDHHERFLTYRELADQLIPYARDMGFTHIELLPVAEHPFDGSWGYQVTGYFAPTSRFGTPDDFKYFVDQCHQSGLGVIVDWVPAHFPKDAHGLARFDGTPLFEHADPRQGEHRDWGTLIFNYGRHEVRCFLLSNALHWIEEFHIDGLRVDAVASMLYLDYSRQAGEWIPNAFGGRENLEAVDFLKRLNEVLHAEHPGVLTFAEESTAWPMVSRPTYLGGLGFDFKWNMGWMNDTLRYFHLDPVHRKFHHGDLTFSLVYAFTENFILPFSHDEVVHGKGSMLNKMPGDDWQKFANFRALLVLMFAHPGKKLLFMGMEFGQWAEWKSAYGLDWHLTQYDRHWKLQHFLRDLNRLYREFPALHEVDFSWEGFTWIDLHDSENSVLSFFRNGRAPGERVVCVINLTPVPREAYRLGVPGGGDWVEVLNSDSEYYGGGNLGNAGRVPAEPLPWMGQAQSIRITLPPLSGLLFRPASP
jgi:1,4-alpha-glucan branching enzyme